MSYDTKTLIEFIKSNGFERLEWDGSEITCYYPKNDEPFGAVEFTGSTHKTWSDLELSLSGYSEFEMSLKDDKEASVIDKNNPAIKEAYIEAKYRRRIAAQLTAAMEKRGVSYRQLAKAMNTGKSQVQRLLNKERGGSLTLLTIVKAALALGLRVEELLVPETSDYPGEAK